MPRLRNTRTGVVVNVRDGKTLDGYEAVDSAGASAGDTSGAPKGNASRDEWAAYADSLGVQYDEGAGREDIKSAIDAK